MELFKRENYLKKIRGFYHDNETTVFILFHFLFKLIITNRFRAPFHQTALFLNIRLLQNS